MPVLPITHSPFNVGVLRTFATATKQQHDTLPRLSVVHAITWSNIDTQLPNAMTAEFVIAEVAVFDSIRFTRRTTATFA